MINRPRTRGKSLLERIMTHYSCTRNEAQLKLDSGDYSLPKVGFRRDQPNQRARM